MSAPTICQEGCVVRATHRRPGRTLCLAPATAPLRHLHYSRIILDGAAAPLEFSTAAQETGLICLNGSATVEVAASRFELARYDALYVPRESTVRIHGRCDLAEVSAPVSRAWPVQFVSFAEVQGDPTLHFDAGGPCSRREVNILIGKNVEAGRILAGVTFSQPGNWTSWPPHEHAATLEEVYLYIDMPAPAWGVQLVYTDPQAPELVVVVRQGDCVVMPGGYHPNVASPGSSINFLWMMAAHREVEDRQFGVVNVQPEYTGSGSGLEAARGTR